MFQWLRNQVRPFFGRDVIEDLVAGRGVHIVHRAEQHDEEDKRRLARTLEQERSERERARRDPFWAYMESRRKRELLEIELKDAEWILEYEKRLITLQKKTATQRSQAEQVGANTDRLRRLEHHLAGLRRNLSLD